MTEEALEAYLGSVSAGIPPWLIPEAAAQSFADVRLAEQDADEDTHWTYDHDLDQVAGSPWLQD